MRKNRLPSLLMMAAMLATTAVFTACSDDDDAPEKDPTLIVAGDDDPLGEPIGLKYFDFLAEDDVIHNADTTQLTISKALADSMGITNFVNRPMGVWDKKEHSPYLRRATEQRLVGDRYVLKVVRSSLAEVIGTRDVTLNTGIYYNPAAPLQARTRAAAFGDMEASQYVDDDNVIHPMALTFHGQSDDGSNGESNWDAPYDLKETVTIAELYAYSQDPSNSIFDDIGDWFKDTYKKVATAVEHAVDYIVEKTSYEIDGEKSGSIIHTNTKLSHKQKISCGEDDSDTITINFNCPIQFDLDYTIKAKAKGSIKTVGFPVPSYLETYIDGYLEAIPQATIGFSKEVSLPEDKQRINLVKFTGVEYLFSIGPVPVSIKIVPSVYLKFTASVAGSAYIGISYDIATKFRAGFKYDGGFSGIGYGQVVKNEFDFLRPTVELEAKAGVGLYFGAEVILEELGGPTFNVGPQVNANAKLKYVFPDDHLDFSAEAKAGIGGEVGGIISVFGFDLAEWKTSFDIGPQWTIFKYPDDGTTDKDNPSGNDYSGYNYIPSVGTGGTGATGYDKVVDGNRNTKWETFERVGGLWYIEFKSRAPITPSGYCLTTGVGGDYNPAAWKLYGKRNLYDEWELLDSRSGTGLLPSDKNSEATFSCKKMECRYFRFEVSKNIRMSIYGNQTEANVYGLSLSEIELLEGEIGKTVDLSTLKTHYIAHNGDVLTGTLGDYHRPTPEKIVIEDGATVTLNNAKIYSNHGIICKGDATIILQGKNSVSGGNIGIYVPKGKTLTIKGSGSLYAEPSDGAGIGGYYKTDCGNIIIDGGNIDARGSYYCPGIGACYNQSCGNITITKNVISVTAQSYSSYTPSIGLASKGSSTCGTITIGGTVYYDGTKYVNGGEEYLNTKPFVYKP